MEVFQGIVSTIIAAIVGLVGYLHKRLVSRVDLINKDLDVHRRDIDTKLERREVKEVVDDKLAPLIVTLQDIKKDLDEIGRDVKKITRKGF